MQFVLDQSHHVRSSSNFSCDHVHLSKEDWGFQARRNVCGTDARYNCCEAFSQLTLWVTFGYSMTVFLSVLLLRKCQVKVKGERERASNWLQCETGMTTLFGNRTMVCASPAPRLASRFSDICSMWPLPSYFHRQEKTGQYRESDAGAKIKSAKKLKVRLQYILFETSSQQQCLKEVKAV